MIKVTGLSKRYGTHLAVNNVNFNIEKGEVIGFLGPNGAGKSTIMNILTGYLSLTQGKVTIDGFDILENPEEAKKRIGYLPEIPPLYVDMKVREYLNFIYDLKKVKFPKKPHIDEVLKLVKIDHVQNRLIKNLSKGYRQRVGFAQALIGNPDVLILDEPTVGLDPNQIIEIRNLISRLGKNHTIILSSHILSEIQAVCKRVIIINKGEIIADDTAENLSDKISSERSLVARIAAGEQDMIDALSTVKGVKSVISLGRKEDGTFDFLIEPKLGMDIRAAVFERVVSRGKTMLSLTSNKLSLEQVFLRLTGAADNDEARRMLGIEMEEDSAATLEKIETAEELKEEEE
ncbi:MAG: ATP-binding cassette domain-containing protein [Acutalibacteraceae bacterium]|nr:ATP-binding cassette domain-containing protein [Acutalibacteraceae bacterium]